MHAHKKGKKDEETNEAMLAEDLEIDAVRRVARVVQEALIFGIAELEPAAIIPRLELEACAGERMLRADAPVDGPRHKALVCGAVRFVFFDRFCAVEDLIRQEDG